MKQIFKIPLNLKFIILSLCVFFFMSAQSFAMDVTLQWDANTEPDLAGYKIYYDTDSGVPYEGAGATEGDSPIGMSLVEDENPDIYIVEYTIHNLPDNYIWYFSVTAYDDQGLESGYSDEASTGVDPPIVTGITPNNDTTPTWSWTPGGGGNGTFRHKLNDSDLTSGATQTTDTSYTHGTALSEGPHTLYVQEQDNASNWSDSGTFTIVIDITPPNTPGVSGNTLTNNTTPTWNWTSGGGGGNGTFRYKLDDSNLTSGATQTTDTSYTPGTALSEGSHTLFVQEQDNANNWSNSGTFTTVIDVTQPSDPAIITDGGNGPGNDYSTTDSSITLEGTCSDDTVAIYVNGSTQGVTFTSETSWFYTGTLGPGDNVFIITAEDAAGNLSNEGSIVVTYSSESPVIVETIPYDGAGIDDNTRVPNNTSFAVRIEDSNGIDITDTTSIQLTITASGENPYTRDISNSDVIRIIKLTADNDVQVTQLWAVYDRSEDTDDTYPFDSDVTVSVIAKDNKDNWMSEVVFSFKVESEVENIYANNPINLPYTEESTEGDLITITVVSDDILNGCQIIYNTSEPITPSLGPSDEVPSLDVPGITSVGMPMNLQPPTVFNDPVTLVIPCTDEVDVRDLKLYLHNGSQWAYACSSFNTGMIVQPGGEGWIVPGSLECDSDTAPPTLEVQVYHFTGIQAGFANGNDPEDDPVVEDSSGRSSGGSGGCFIAAPAHGSLIPSGIKILCQFREKIHSNLRKIFSVLSQSNSRE